jgi:hypothetical protein
MSLWLVLALMAFVKLVMASVMLWVTLRSDSAMVMHEDAPADSDSDDEGGSKVLIGAVEDPHHPRRPLPHGPRRGPHGSPSPHVPARIRIGRTRVVARSAARH